jgi:N-succinyl-L-ornithine transcarbamylase
MPTLSILKLEQLCRLRTNQIVIKLTVTAEKMALTNNAKFMHCLPVRRNVIVTDEVLDSENSIVIEQANNRTYAAQLVLQKILENEQ